MEVKQVEGGDGEAEWRLRLTDGNFEICNGKTVAATFGWLTTERDYTIWPLTPSWRDPAPRLDNENGLTVIAVIPLQPWQWQWQWQLQRCIVGPFAPTAIANEFCLVEQNAGRARAAS